MVEFNHVTKVYDRDIVSVDDINFKIDKGEFVFLIGPSGSGKTTIIKMLIRDEIPTDGRVFFDDVDITKINRRKVYKLRREIGVIFQDFKLVPDKTAFENVAFAMEAAGKTNKDIQETVPYVLDIVGLSSRMKSFPRQLSGGEQQRVAIARAIANNPKILIADEPTGNLDPASSWDIVQVLTKINNWGTTVIMSTHGTDIVNSLNKRVIQMDKGKVIRDDNKGQYEMVSAFENNILSAEKSERKEKKKNKKTYQVKLESDEKPDNSEAIPPEKNKNSKFRRMFNIFRRKHESNEPISEVIDTPVTELYKEDTSSELDEANNQTDKSILEKELSSSKESVEEKPKLSSSKEIEEDLNNSENNNLKEDSSTNEISEENSNKEIEKISNKKSNKVSKKTLNKKDLSWSEDSIKNFMENSKKMKVDELDLPKAVIKDLKAAGYKEINNIIEAGPEKLSQSLLIDPEEIIMVSKAIKELLESYSQE